MKRCEDFEIAIEMKLHGALDGPAAVELAEHLPTCVSCRSFETLSKHVETTMTTEALKDAGGVNWQEMTARVRASLSKDTLLRFKMAGVVLVADLVVTWALSAGHRQKALSSGLVMAAILICIVGATAFMRARRLRQYEQSRGDLLYFYREFLETRLRRTFRAMVLLPLAAAGLLVTRVAQRSQVSGLDWLGIGLMLSVLLAVAGYLCFVRTPALRRELETLKRG